MPAWKPTDQDLAVNTFDVCAQFGDDPNVLRHALLCNEATAWSVSSRSIKCVHMGPPLLRGAEQADMVGSAELVDTERLSIDTFVKARVSERRAHKKRLRLVGQAADRFDQYIIFPAVERPSKHNSLWRFSCVGFVLQAYSMAGIDLLASSVPEIGLPDLLCAYPDATAMTQSDRAKMGIGVGKTWPVVFVGYVMASLAREADEIRQQPYTPLSAEIRFTLPNDQ